MDDTVRNRPICRRRIRVNLQSASGAFDLPSILIGVAVVAILAIGVMAAIFGVIPWAQDNAAKQDLTAVYTAQGTAYARDAQEYKDLNGLENTGLISDLDPEKVQITVSEDGKGYQAVTTSNTGKKWFITHDSPTPREWEDKAASRVWLNTPAWASDRCTPAVVDSVVLSAAPSHPGFIELMKQDMELPYDQLAIDELMGIASAPRPALTDAEREVLADLSGEPAFRDLEREFAAAQPMDDAAPDLERIAAAQLQFSSGVDAWMISFCHA